MYKPNGYELSRAFFDWAFENPEKIKPSHGILYFFIIEHCNRLGWKSKFGLPTTMAKEAIGIKSYNTYINALNDLVDWGFVVMIEKSKNQHSSNIVALSNFNKALDKALDKALVKHASKHVSKQRESNSSIDKQKNNKQKNNIPPSIELLYEYFNDKRSNSLEAEKFLNYYTSNGWKVGKNKMIDWHAAASGWISRLTNPSKPKIKPLITSYPVNKR